MQLLFFRLIIPVALALVIAQLTAPPTSQSASKCICAFLPVFSSERRGRPIFFGGEAVIATSALPDRFVVIAIASKNISNCAPMMVCFFFFSGAALRYIA